MYNLVQAIALWNADIEEPNFNRPDPEKRQYKLASANEGDKQQLHFGVPQVTPPPMYGNPPTTVPVVGSAEAVGLAMAIGGSHSVLPQRTIHYIQILIRALK
ncbi:hypothetical protein NC653_022223 [Populus alba x Populus x berolinensis]|nr:hypothetical protein NC653_022223 [Populus alba x Populus x berolinensis]